MPLYNSILKKRVGTEESCVSYAGIHNVISVPYFIFGGVR